MIPVGLDLSLTSTGVSHRDGRYAIASKFKGMERLRDLRDKILYDVKHLTNFDSVLVLVEGYSFGSRASQAHAAGELGGVIRLGLYEAGIDYLDVPPTCLKKFATGKGNASKSEVASAISARTGIVFSGKGADDIVDAFALEQMGLVKLGRSEYSWPKVNLESFDKLDWTSVGL